MRVFAVAQSLWRTVFRSRRLDRELDDELRSYLEARVARHRERGLTDEAARRAASLDLGGLEQVKEQVRAGRMGASIDECLRDIRYAVRLIRRTPGFAAVVIVTMALAIGANATVFSVIRGVVWKPLPYPAGDRLVLVSADARGLTDVAISDAEAIDLRAQPHLVDALATIVRVDAHVSVDGEMEQTPAVSVTDDALPLLGTPLAHGRVFDGRRDFANDGFVRSVIISHDLWQRRFGGDVRAVGRRIEVNNLDVEVVGILREDFRLYLPASTAVTEVAGIWFPRPFDHNRRARGTRVGTVARLRHGVSLDDAQAQLDVLSQRLMTDYPTDYNEGPLRLVVKPVRDEVTAAVRPAMWALAGAVGCVLLIGCVNVGNLMLARARARSVEVAVRHALGGTRWRVVRHVLFEAVVLALVGGVVGLALTYAGIAVIDWLRPVHLPRRSAIRVDGAVIAFTAAVSIVMALVCAGCAVTASSGSGTRHPIRSGRSDVQRPGVRRFQRLLVTVEVALCIVPLVAGGLMLQTFLKLSHAPLGFRPDGVLTAKVAYSVREFSTRERRLQLMTAAIERVRDLPGVRGVSAGGPLPLDYQFTRPYSRPDDDQTLTSLATIQSVFPDYLAITGVQLKTGRDFTVDDLVAQRRVAIVDDRIARQLWPNGGALGQPLLLGQGGQPAVFEIVGVTSPVRALSARDASTPHIFVPFEQFNLNMALVVGTNAPVSGLGIAIKQVVESLGTRRPVFDIQPMRVYVDRSMAETQFTMLVMVVFAVAALVMAAIGVYGTLTYLTAQRRQEFAVRLALGASGPTILRGVIGEALVLTAMGVIAGVLGAVATSSVLHHLLYDLPAIHWPTLVTVATLVGAIAVVATAQPAWRASRIDPAAVLRAQ